VSAVIDVSASLPNRVLMEPVVGLLAWPAGEPGNVFERQPLDAKPSGASLAEQFISMVNQVRAQIGVGPLSLEQRQSATITRLAPHFFAAVGGGAGEDVAETVALGIIAGWDVNGLVQSGAFTSGWLASSQEVPSLVELFLAHPGGREVLLDPRVSRVAVGSFVEREHGALAAVVSTYALHGSEGTSAQVKRLLERLNAERAKKNLDPVVWVATPGDTDARIAELLQSDDAKPQEALELFTDGAMNTLRRSVRGFMIQASSLEELELPEELLTRGQLGVMISVAVHRPKAEPWARFVVLFAMGDLPQQPMAQR
jgi:hypothetical protein